MENRDSRLLVGSRGTTRRRWYARTVKLHSVRTFSRPRMRK